MNVDNTGVVDAIVGDSEQPLRQTQTRFRCLFDHAQLVIITDPNEYPACLHFINSRVCARLKATFYETS